MPAPSIGVPSGIRSTQREYQTVTSTPGNRKGPGLPLDPRVRAPTVVTRGRQAIICAKASPLLTVRGLGAAVLRSPSPRRVYRRLLAQGQGSAEIAAAPESLIEALRLSARRPENARTVASLMHAIDRFRRPRPESVLTTAELAAITTPTIFILGSEDPYLSAERAQTSIDQIHGARLYEMPGGHAPWLADAQHAAALIATHPHLTAGPHLSPAPGEGRQANAPG